MTREDEAPAEPAFDLDVRGCLEFLWPALPEALVGKAERHWVEAAASKLPPIGSLALEFRLGPGEHNIDLHQHFRANSTDPTILRRYLPRAADDPLGDRAVRKFLAGWADGTDGVRDVLPSLYIEWDRPPAGTLPAAPGIFLPVEPAGGSRAERLLDRAAAIDWSNRIQPGLGDEARAVFDRLADRLPCGASLNYMGFMLGRAGALRVNLRGVRRPDLGPLLEGLGWQGPIGTATRHFEQLVDLSDRVIVGLDFTPALEPSIGFEVALDAPPLVERRWRKLFDYFVGQGACTEENGRALEALPAHFFPEDRGQPWPASWLVAAVLSQKRCVPWVERRVSHLKLVISGHGSVSAKAYVYARHHWSRVAPASMTRRLSCSSPPDALLAAAADKAVGFIVAAIGQDDWWRDFGMPGASDEWATAFVGWALNVAADERANSATKRALEALLLRQREDGGWGYNGRCAPDADSTAWALKFLKTAKLTGPASAKAEAFLLSHRLPEGGVATYSAGAQVLFNDAPWNGPSEGWRSAHACVTANAAGALPGVLAHWLRAAQRPDGSWRAYWWRTDAFSTALAVDALEGDENAATVARALSWARQQAPLAGSAFDRAWLSRILIRGSAGDIDRARHILAELAQEQGADGGWAAGAQLLLPHPSQLGPDESLVPFLDVRRLFTTASVLVALAALGGIRVP